MTTARKTPAIVQCTLGGTGMPLQLKTGKRQHRLSHVLLRIGAQDQVPQRSVRLRHDLALDVRDDSAEALRGTLSRISERFQILALIPPIGFSSQHLHLGRTIAALSDDMALPGFSEAAFATTMNRYLTRCHWQNKGLPTTAFSLIQFPSAIEPAIAAVGLPARLSPLHYALPHLEANILHEPDAAKAYQLIARTLQRQALAQPHSPPCQGEDPRTHHHIRFSLFTDQLLVASPVGNTVEFTIVIRDGVPKTATAAPIITRDRTTPPKVSRAQIAKMGQLAIAGCVTLGIKTGVVCCKVRHTAGGDFLDGIIPNYIDERATPMLPTMMRNLIGWR